MNPQRKGIQPLSLLVFILSLFASFQYTELQAQVFSRKTGADVAAIIVDTASGTRADVTYSPGTITERWREKLGSGNDLAFLAANFDGQRSDDLASICLAQNGDSQMRLSAGPGTSPGVIWKKVLRSSKQLTYYFLAGDFNGDGSSDIAAFYTAPSAEEPDNVRAKITFGPDGSLQTSDAEDWQIGAARKAAFVAGNFIATDRADEIAVISRDVNNNLIARFVGLSKTQLSWMLGSGTPLAFRSGDFNKDGKADIAAIFAGANKARLARLISGPNGEISAEEWKLGSGEYRALLKGDFNNDGSDDLAVASSAALQNTAQLFFNPNLQLPPVSWTLASGAKSAFVAGDFNSDLTALNVQASDGDTTHPLSVRVSWEDTPGATGYRVYRALLGESNFAALSPDVLPGAQLYDDFSAEPGRIYDYMVRALSAKDEGLDSNIDSGYRFNDDGSLPAPTAVQASDGDLSHPAYVSVRWNAVATATHYQVARAELDAATPSFTVLAVLPATQREYQDNTATPGVVYLYRLRTQRNAEISGDGPSNIDSGYRWESALPPAPINVEASDNDCSHPSTVRVNWTTVGGVSGYRISRKFSGASSASYITLADVEQRIRTYDDSTATPGVVYDYRVRSLLNAQESLDGPSNIDSGYRPNNDCSLPAPTEVQATDGTFKDKVQVSWRPVGGAQSYIVYRANTAGENGLEIASGLSTPLFDDKTAVPCVKYYYYVKAVRGTELSAQSLRDSGYRDSQSTCTNVPQPPQNLQASDSDPTLPDFIRITWDAVDTALSYELYRSQYPGDIGAMIASGLSARIYEDRQAVPGGRYYYTAIAVNDVGKSSPSAQDEGRRFDPSGIEDCDSDGVSDAQELIDGTGICDPGSFRLHLKSPAFSKYNTFLDQWNFLELMANGTKDVIAKVSVLDINGKVLWVDTLTLKPFEQIDVNVGEKVAQADTYGVVRIDFNDKEPGATLTGRLSNYRLDANKSTFGYAFARELRNPTRGVTYSTSNTYDAGGKGFLVPNWAEIMNLDEVERVFTFNLYDTEGNKIVSRKFSVPAFGEADVQAGHENGPGTYLAEFVPADGATRYFAAVARYSSNLIDWLPTTNTAFYYAFTVDGRAGTGSEQYIASSNQVGKYWSQSNWIEVVNVREKIVTFSANFRDGSGKIIASTTRKLKPFEQYHLNAAMFLNKGTYGSVALIGDAPGAIIAQGITYYHDTQKNQLQAAYSSVGRIAGQDVQGGSFNTYLGLQSLLRVISTSGEPAEFGLELTYRGNKLVSEINQITAQGHSMLELSDAARFGTKADMYGTITLSTKTPKRIAAEILRQREIDGRIDFAMSTRVE